MNANGRPPDPPDLRFFDKNRHKFPPEQLLPFGGQFVAWSADGTRIVASADEREGLYKKLEEMGVHFSQVVFEYIYPPDMVVL